MIVDLIKSLALQTLSGVTVQSGDSHLTAIDSATGQVGQRLYYLGGGGSAARRALAYDPETGSLYDFETNLSVSRTSVRTLDPDTGNFAVLPGLDLSYISAAGYSPDRGDLVLIVNQDEAYHWKEGSDPVPAAAAPRMFSVRFVTTIPDLALGEKIGRLRGNNLRNASGGGQTVRIKAKRKKSAHWRIQSENDGNNVDPISPRGTKGNRKMKVLYRFAGRNVTAAVTHRGHSSLHSPRQSGLYSLKVRRVTSRKAKRNFVFRFTSEDGSDAARAKFLLKP